jgi:hypothetical protein
MQPGQPLPPGFRTGFVAARRWSDCHVKVVPKFMKEDAANYELSHEWHVSERLGYVCNDAVDNQLHPGGLASMSRMVETDRDYAPIST